MSYSRQERQINSRVSMELTPPLPDNSEMTKIGYCYGRKTVPYTSQIPGKKITLKQFKSIHFRKGNFRYFFKRVCDEFETGGTVFEEVFDDDEILPLWDGKIFCIMEPKWIPEMKPVMIPAVKPVVTENEYEDEDDNQSSRRFCGCWKT